MSIIKYDFNGDELAEFDIGDKVNLEDYGPDPIDNGYYVKEMQKSIWWPGTSHCVIINIFDYDGDVDDDTGRTINIPASADIAIVPRQVSRGYGFINAWIEKFNIDEIFEQGELWPTK